jgi:hypothetical protein
VLVANRSGQPRQQAGAELEVVVVQPPQTLFEERDEVPVAAIQTYRPP